MPELALFGGTPVRTTPFHSWPIYGHEEEDNLVQVLKKSKWGVGKRTGVINEFEEKFAQYHNASSAVACSNCTHALEVALAAYGIQAGDEVIVPAYTFIATASAVAKLGATPVFADINKYLVIDPYSIESLITSKTKAIIPVHFSGHFADMEAIKSIADDHKLVIVEDAAQAHGAKWDGVYPGHYGPATFSFQYSKNMTAGEGGIIISNDETFINKCWEYIWHGRKKGGLWYEHFATTSNYRMTEWSAAVLLAQLDRLSEQNKRRMDNAEYLTELLKKDGFIIPTPIDRRIDIHSRHLFMMQLDQHLFKDIPKTIVTQALVAEGLPIVPGYQFPLYKNPAFQDNNWGLKGLRYDYDYTKVNLPKVEQACIDTIWIIHHILLGTRQDMDDIIKGIKKVANNIKELKGIS